MDWFGFKIEILYCPKKFNSRDTCMKIAVSLQIQKINYISSFPGGAIKLLVPSRRLFYEFKSVELWGHTVLEKIQMLNSIGKNENKMVFVSLHPFFPEWHLLFIFPNRIRYLYFLQNCRTSSLHSFYFIKKISRWHQ